MTTMPPITPEVKAWIEWYIKSLNSYNKYYVEQLKNIAKPPEQYRPDLIGKYRDDAHLQLDTLEQAYFDMAFDLEILLDPNHSDLIANAYESTIDIPPWLDKIGSI